MWLRLRVAGEMGSHSASQHQQVPCRASLPIAHRTLVASPPPRSLYMLTRPSVDLAFPPRDALALSAASERVPSIRAKAKEAADAVGGAGVAVMETGRG